MLKYTSVNVPHYFDQIECVEKDENLSICQKTFLKYKNQPNPLPDNSIQNLLEWLKRKL